MVRAHNLPALLSGCCLAVLLLSGCLAAPPPQTPFPPPTDAAPLVIRDSAVSAVQLYFDGRVRCTAVVVAPNTALTARHCADSEVAPAMLDLDGVERPVVVDMLVPEVDLAWLSFDEAVVKPVKPAARPPEPGELGWLVGYGCSGSKRLEARPARFLRQWYTIDPTKRWMDEWEGDVCHGDSGGAALNQWGELVGILIEKGTGDNKHRAYATPVPVPELP